MLAKLGKQIRPGLTAGLTTALIVVLLLCPVASPALELASDTPDDSSTQRALQPIGRLLDHDSARVVVRHEPCRCAPLGDDPDILLLTVGVETNENEQTSFQPVASFAFDRSLRAGNTGAWLAMWVYGPSGAGAGRNTAALLPVPLGGPGASSRKLEKLEAQLERLRAGDTGVQPKPPKPFLNLYQVGLFPRTGGLGSLLQRILKWVDFYNPAQFIYRSYRARSNDRGGRAFQRAYLSIFWLLDAEFDGQQDNEWLATFTRIRFHLLRTRSIWGRFLTEADARDLVLGYESTVRERLGKSSAWLQTAANEHYLRYQPIYRYTANQRSSPIGGVLYYDPRIPRGDPGWWNIANPFDLPYNPHTHPAVQRLAREHPDDMIPLAVYTFQTGLKLRPIVAIDFFSPGNPRMRERNQQLMHLLGNWLAIATGGLSLDRIPYRAVTWAANKKGYTLLTNQNSRLGLEELRLALETGLYFDPQIRRELLRRADRRVLNPLVRSGPEERLRAQLQYESLRARDFEGLCQQVKKVRRDLRKRLGVPDSLAAEPQRKELARRLISWRQQSRLKTLAERATGDYGTLEQLRVPLDHFQQAQPPFPKNLEKTFAETYQKLYQAELRLTDTHGLPELASLRAQTQQVWRRIAGLQGNKNFEKKLSRAEARARKQFRQEQKKAQKHQAKELRNLLKESRKELQRAARNGCDPTRSSPADLEAILALLYEVAQVASQSERLRAELDIQRDRLKKSLREVETSLAQCPVRPDELYRADSRTTSRRLARAVIKALNGHKPEAAAALTGDN